ncbi:MAG: FliI/YscN family ATPase [Chloroflexi bacterium]|nr:FliI/YscN family ATPase [Chloroflexota bacterium]
MIALDLARYHTALRDRSVLRFQGRVAQVIGLSIEVEGLRLAVGDVCTILPNAGGRPALHAPDVAGADRRQGGISAEVVGFRDNRLIVMPFSDTQGVRPGSAVFPRGRAFNVPVGPSLLGRVIDGLAQPIDGLGPLGVSERYPVTNQPPDPLTRQPIRETLSTGVRAIDAILTCGKGQRIGIFAGSGVGKSTALGMIARNARADVNVIALIGERGREVQEFMERDLGPDGLARSVVVVATSDQPALQRIKAAWVATAIAEWFREQGLDVTLMMDSVTRWAMAQREIGLTVGEPPVVKGYPPSVFALMPKLMEKAGTSHRGTVTGFYTVLVDGDDVNEPIADTARGVLDGHIWLSRRLANENHYPAIDVLGSISRLMSSLAVPAHQRAASHLRDAMATYRASEDLISIGAYQAGANPSLDRAVTLMPRIRDFLCQSAQEATTFEDAVRDLCAIFPSEADVGNT